MKIIRKIKNSINRYLSHRANKKAFKGQDGLLFLNDLVFKGKSQWGITNT